MAATSGPSEATEIRDAPRIGDGMIETSSVPRFLTRPTNFDTSTPSKKEKWPTRQPTTAPGTTVEIIVPGVKAFVTNPSLEFDIQVTFKLVPRIIPYCGGLPTVKNAIVGLLSNGGNLTDIGTRLFLRSGFNPAADNNDTQQSFLNYGALNGQDYALDFRTNIGVYGLFSQVQLLSANGLVIDESNSSLGYEHLVELMFSNSLGEKGAELDRSLLTNIYQWAPEIDSHLLMPKGVSGTLRANGVQLDLTAQTITFTKHVCFPVPLTFNQDCWPVRYLGGGQDLRLKILTNPMQSCGWCAAPRFYSGTMNLREDQRQANVYVYDDQTQTQNLIVTVTPITGYCFTPWLPAPAVQGFEAITTSRAEGIGCVLRVVLNAIKLSTSDLSAILGDPILTLPGNENTAWPIGVDGANNLTYPNMVFPTCSMMNNGFTFQVCLEFIDDHNLVIMDTVPSTTVGVNATTMPAAAAQDDFAHQLVGNPVIRSVWVSIPVQASEIAAIQLMMPQRIAPGYIGDAEEPAVPRNNAAAYTTALQYSDVLTGAIPLESDIGSEGNVYIVLNHNKAIDIPVYGADFTRCTSNVRSVNTLAGVATTLAHARVPWTSFDPTSQLTNQEETRANKTSGINNTTLVNAAALNWGIKYVVSTNTPSLTGRPLNSWSQETQAGVLPIPVFCGNICQEADGSDTLALTAAFAGNVPADPTFVSAGVNTKQPYVNYPINVTYTNWEFNFEEPLLEPETIEALDELYEDTSGPGIRFEAACYYIESFPLNSVTAREIIFETVKSNIYFFQFGLRDANPLDMFGKEGGMPWATFSYWKFSLGSTQLIDRPSNYQLQCLGGMWPQQVPILTGQGINPWGMIKGTGMNSFISDRIRIAWGNVFGADTGAGDDVVINMPYFDRCNYKYDLFIPPNSHGGATALPRQTKWKLTFGIQNQYDSANIYVANAIYNDAVNGGYQTTYQNVDAPGVNYDATQMDLGYPYTSVSANSVITFANGEESGGGSPGFIWAGFRAPNFLVPPGSQNFGFNTQLQACIWYRKVWIFRKGLGGPVMTILD